LAGQIRVAVHLRRQLESGRRREDLRAVLGLSPRYPQDKAFTQAAGYPPGVLERAYARLLEIDWTAKTGQGELETALDLFVLAGPLAAR
jgi:DNA polymerase III delta subunit